MQDYKKALDKYISDIQSGKIAACDLTKKAIQRHLNDLKRSKDEDFPFYFDMEAAEKMMRFAEELKPGDMNGKTIHLLPWQIFCYANIEGWRWKYDPDRKRFRLCYIELNRKNGKTTGILEPVTLYNFLKYPACESYLVSSRDDLAEKTYGEIKAIIQNDDTLDEVLDPKSQAVTFKDISETSRLSFFCDGGKDADGFKPRFYCLDEYHAFASDKMFSSMQLGLRSKKDAQGVIITTADVEVNGPCYEQSLKAKRILNGLQTQEDFFTIIFCLDENDDYHDPAVWQKANPSLYDIIDPSVIQSDIDDAELTPHKIPELKAKTFGIWGGGSEKSWLPIEVWQKNKDVKASEEEFKDCICCAGLDLAQVDDMCAYTKVFIKDGKEYYFHKFYIPEETVKARYQKENINFLQWVESGIITAIPGATIDYRFIIKDIVDDAAKYKLIALGYDKWQARNVIDGIEEQRPDIALIEIEQSMKKLSSITKDYEKLIKDGLLVDNNPVMIWMVNNVDVFRDPNDNIKLKKKSKGSNQHIDGVISSLMAHSLINNPEVNIPPIKAIDYDLLKAVL